MALASAVATLLAALFICLGPGTDGKPGDGMGSGTGAGTDASAGRHPDLGHQTRVHQAHAQYSCPYDEGDCRLFPHASPAVLTVPPPAAPLATEGHLPRLAPAHPTGRPTRSGAHPRAPDLHVLQVLRT
ncbi:DUF2946 family protein [Streptomyces sp. NPDC051569]|uniref:DUF2946 family protein n=1 Tax=Streptomyces sp. NPDC051569 TaxID=3365661 RepID=UPI0037BB97F2